VSVVAFRGEVDLEHSPTARKALLACVGRGRDLLVDLSQVSYLDSSGIASLVEAFQEARRNGTRFGLVRVGPRAMQVFELARLDQVFSIYASLEEGLADVG
jgi:anti-sigma B factor antagonist